MSKQSTVELAQKLLATVPESEIIFHPDIVSDAKQLAQAVVEAEEIIRDWLRFDESPVMLKDSEDWLSKHSSGGDK